MIHPLVDDLTSFTDEEIDVKIRDLTKKYSIANRSNNHNVLTQIANLLTIYKSERSLRYEKAKMQNDNGQDLDDLINVE